MCIKHMQVEAGKLSPLLVTFPCVFRVPGVGGRKGEEFTNLIAESNHFSPPPSLPSFLHELFHSVPGLFPARFVPFQSFPTDKQRTH